MWPCEHHQPRGGADDSVADGRSFRPQHHAGGCTTTGRRVSGASGRVRQNIGHGGLVIQENSITGKAEYRSR